MREIIKNNIVLARHITAENIKEGLNFFSQDSEFIQVGAWKYQKDTKLKAHVHNLVERKINRTCEVLYVIKGKLRAVIYDLENTPIEELTVSQGEILVLLECGHGYTLLEDETTVLEVKTGPYLGAEIDRRRIE